MSSWRTLGLLLGAALLAGTAAAQPSNIRKARLEVRRVAPGELARAMRELAAAPGARWVAWSEAVHDRRQQACCFGAWDGSRDDDRRLCCGRCTLEKEDDVAVTDRNTPVSVRLEDPGEFLVLARAEHGKIERLRVFSPDCEIDAGGMTVVVLGGVTPEESVAYLATLALAAAGPDANLDDDEDAPETGHLADSCLLAVAMHAGHEADAELERLLGRGRPLAIRNKAAFWLGVSRGRGGYEILARTVPGDPVEAFRRQGTFALSQSREEDATRTLVTMARRDPSGEVRGQALFWLAQKAGRKAAAAIQDSIRDDPDTDVKKKAVFALSQLPGDEGVVQLIRVARANRNPEVRRQAFFWLGQSKDPKALAFIEEVLAK